jgi:hypothetical protein
MFKKLTSQTLGWGVGSGWNGLGQPSGLDVSLAFEKEREEYR